MKMSTQVFMVFTVCLFFIFPVITIFSFACKVQNAFKLHSSLLGKLLHGSVRLIMANLLGKYAALKLQSL